MTFDKIPKPKIIYNSRAISLEGPKNSISMDFWQNSKAKNHLLISGYLTRRSRQFHFLFNNSIFCLTVQHWKHISFARNGLLTKFQSLKLSTDQWLFHWMVQINPFPISITSFSVWLYNTENTIYFARNEVFTKFQSIKSFTSGYIIDSSISSFLFYCLIYLNRVEFWQNTKVSNKYLARGGKYC